MGKKYSLGDMIFDLIYNIYDFDEDAVIVFATARLNCHYCNHLLHRLKDEAHYLTCACGKRYMFRRQKCARCDSDLEGLFCTDKTCPFSDRKQDDPDGWIGHPEKEAG